MTAIEFLKKLDLNKFNLAEVDYALGTSGVFWMPTFPSFKNTEIEYSKWGFMLPIAGENNKALSISHDPEYTKVSVSGYGITYASTDLTREDRFWLEDWSRHLCEEIHRLKEQKLNSLLA